jgi:DUF4097 and DUF4098 domain-containing protein YvlB
MMLRQLTNARAGALLCALLLAPAGMAVPAAQQNSGDDWCREERGDSDRQRVCEVRRFTVPATAGVLTVQGTNGGISVEGQARGDVQILAKVTADAPTQARAREIAKAISVNPTLERVESEGPRELQDREGWSVSYRLAVPRALNMSLRTTNGGIVIQDVDSSVEFATTNGGVKLRHVEGNVRGRTTNGGVDVELDGPSWQGDGLDVETTNGGVRLVIPEHYSAQLEAHTNNGGLSIDVPGAVNGRSRRDAVMQLGSGGAPIRLRTSNGGVRVTRK